MSLVLQDDSLAEKLHVLQVNKYLFYLIGFFGGHVQPLSGIKKKQILKLARESDTSNSD